MVSIGSGAQRTIEDWALSRYGCYLVIQNADPGKPLVARFVRLTVNSLTACERILI
jgi:hypothetical protein